MSEQHHTVFQLVGVPHEYNAIAGSLLVAAALTAGGIIVKSKLKNLDDNILPEGRFSLLNFSTMIVGMFRNLINGMIDHGGDRFLPFIGTTFLYILLMNLMGLIPGFLPPSDNINTNLAMALSVFIFYHYLGIREHGTHYIGQFTGGLPPKGYGALMTGFLSIIACVLFVIESIGHLIRPVSLSLRLWGNINGDHTLVGVFNGITPVIVPIIFMILGVFVCCVQAFVFSLLSTVYIKMAVSHDH